MELLVTRHGGKAFLVAAAVIPSVLAPLRAGADAPAPPRLKRAEKAVYPEAARRARAEGEVVLRLRIGTTGRVEQATVVREPGHGLGEAARAAALRFLFEPARHAGKSVPSIVRYRYTFRLREVEPPPTRPAPEPAPTVAYEQEVLGVRPQTAASSAVVRAEDLSLRPLRRPAQVLEVTPGLLVVQHAGGGKANQYFLRGFDADHGSDLAISVDGIPVNMVSHAHGQGYADLHFLIPELVDRIEVSKGPYFAEHGDLATAGAIGITTRSDLEQGVLSLSAGSYQTFRVLAMASPSTDAKKPGVRGRALLAAEVYRTNGPFDNPERLERYNLFAKGTLDLPGAGSLSLLLQSYSAGWNASGQIPLREVEAGRLRRFGFIDPTEGGNSQRHAFAAAYRLPVTGGLFSAVAYAVLYDLAMYSNFTFFATDPLRGDQIEQDDRRTLAGFDARYRFLRRAGGIAFHSLLGVGLRADLIETQLFATQRRERLANSVHADVRQANLGVFAREEISWTSWLRTVFGLRADAFGFVVNDRLEDRVTLGNATSGTRSTTLLSPKASAIFTPAQGTDLFLNFGMGFHSNDARGVVRAALPATPVARATGAEAGVRTRLAGRLEVAALFFLLDLESEIVWVGDEGTTQARGPTRRMGGELEMRWRVLEWLRAELDVTISRATFTQNPGNANAVALAPTVVVMGGLAARHPSGLFGSLRVRAIGDRPATEDRFFTAQGFTVLDLQVGYQHRRFAITLEVDNLLNAVWREAQFANVSRLPQETSGAACGAPGRPVTEGARFLGCEDLHFTPGVPIQGRITLSLFY